MENNFKNRRGVKDARHHQMTPMLKLDPNTLEEETLMKGERDQFLDETLTEDTDKSILKVEDLYEDPFTRFS